MSDLWLGTYRLKEGVSNPEPVAHPDPLHWWEQSYWPPATEFRCYYVYSSLSREVPALYAGKRPETAAHEGHLPAIFAALVPHLERVS